MDAIPTAVCLTTYAGESEDFMRMPFHHLVEQVEAGILRKRLASAVQLRPWPPSFHPISMLVSEGFAGSGLARGGFALARLRFHTPRLTTFCDFNFADVRSCAASGCQ